MLVIKLLYEVPKSGISFQIVNFHIYGINQKSNNYGQKGENREPSDFKIKNNRLVYISCGGIFSNFLRSK